MDQDKLNSTNLYALSKATFNVINTLQREPQAVQVQALSSLFLLLCDVYEVDVRRTLEQVDRMMKDTEKQEWRVEFKAIREYIDKELRKRNAL